MCRWTRRLRSLSSNRPEPQTGRSVTRRGGWLTYVRISWEGSGSAPSSHRRSWRKSIMLTNNTFRHVLFIAIYSPWGAFFGHHSVTSSWLKLLKTEANTAEKYAKVRGENRYRDLLPLLVFPKFAWLQGFFMGLFFFFQSAIRMALFKNVLMNT